jgi:hypothetical protein
VEGGPIAPILRGKVYKYLWGNNELRAKYKGKYCVILARGRMNSVLVQFEDGHRIITSRYSIKEVI